MNETVQQSTINSGLLKKWSYLIIQRSMTKYLPIIEFQKCH